MLDPHGNEAVLSFFSSSPSSSLECILHTLAFGFNIYLMFKPGSVLISLTREGALGCSSASSLVYFIQLKFEG